MKTFDEFFMEEKLDAEDREKIKEDDSETTKSCEEVPQGF